MRNICGASDVVCLSVHSMGDHQWMVLGTITVVVAIVVISNKSIRIDFLSISCRTDLISRSHAPGIGALKV